MAQSWVQAANPIWYTADLTGAPAGGGSIASFNSLNPSVPWPIFQDPAGLLPYPNPILLNMNGTIGPLYFLVDTANPLSNYDLFVYDANGNLIWNINNFTPPSGGGGSVVVSNLNDNLVINNVFYRGQSISTLQEVNILAPSAHSGLTQTAAGFGPDTQFIKNNTTAADSLTLVPFAPGLNPLTGEITPYNYLNYTCTNTPSGESYKILQIPITSKVQSIANQPTSVGIYARSNLGTPSLQLAYAQFFGDGTNTPTTTNVQNIGSAITLTSSWAFYPLSQNIPNVGGATIGNCGNDGLFLQIKYPTNVACNIDICKPSVFLGTTNANFDYTAYDTIEAADNTNRTGDIRVSLNAFQPFGWVAMNDGTIGTNYLSVNSNATTRANLDTFPLYNLLWNAGYSTSHTGSGGIAPMYTNAGSSSGQIAYGATSIADFAAGNQLALTKQAGRVIGAIGLASGSGTFSTTWPLGPAGTETFVMTEAQLATHSHPGSNVANSVNAGSGGITVANGAETGSTPVRVAADGSNAPISLVQATSFYNIFMKL